LSQKDSLKTFLGGDALEKPFIRTKLSTIILLLIFFVQINLASAQDELSDAQIKERLQTIQQMLEQGKSNANRWWYGWLIGYSAATIAQGAIGLTSDAKATRQDMALGAVTTFLGAMGQIITPMVPGSAPNRLAGIAENTPEERKEKLFKAEKLLKDCAIRESEGRSWQAHAITGAANLGSGLIVWLGFKRSVWEGLGNFALNTVITEAQILTQPTRAIHDYDNYLRTHQSGQKLGHRKPDWNWLVNIYPGGLGISVMF
jgi:hypothetical protein